MRSLGQMGLVALLAGGMMCGGVLAGQVRQGRTQPEKAPRPAPDVVIFKNGDQLSGVLLRGVGGQIVFKSDVVGEVTIALEKVKELRSTGSFAALRKDVKVTRESVHPGTILYGDGSLTVADPAGAGETMPAEQIAYLIDQVTYDRELERKPGMLYGWNGGVAFGATLVRSTQNGSTFSTGVNLVRAIPAAPYLPARNRTSFNLGETYGRLTQPVIPQRDPPVPDQVAKTSVFHTDFERDQYFSPHLFALAQTSFDHNFSQGLILQQLYGVGVGATVIQKELQQLDLKADIHYENQQFETARSNQNLVGSTIAETYRRTLPRKLRLTQSASALPAWNNPGAYGANASLALALPLFRRLNLTLTSTDNFLNDPAVGFRKNSFQFVTAVGYTLR